MNPLLACTLTVLIETPFLAAFGYRKGFDLAVIVCSNVLTNLLLNLLLIGSVLLGITQNGYTLLTFVLEIGVFFSEYGIYRAAFGSSRRLALLTAAANALSLLLGLLIQLI
jgi:hypothetical protein